jgi:rhodanese-related sulfurtransferase
MSKEIDRQSIWGEVLEAYPLALRAVFRRYGVGGFGGEGFRHRDALADFCRKRGIDDPDELVTCIRASEHGEPQPEIGATEVAAAIRAGGALRLVDVRTPEEWELARIPGATLMSQELVGEIRETWPKDGVIVFYCHHGQRSLSAARFFFEQGFTNVWSMTGGIEAWSTEIDPGGPRY